MCNRSHYRTQQSYSLITKFTPIAQSTTPKELSFPFPLPTLLLAAFADERSLEPRGQVYADKRRAIFCKSSKVWYDARHHTQRNARACLHRLSPPKILPGPRSRPFSWRYCLSHKAFVETHQLFSSYALLMLPTEPRKSPLWTPPSSSASSPAGSCSAGGPIEDGVTRCNTFLPWRFSNTHPRLSRSLT